MTPLPLLDLFSGIGGFSLGLERTGGFQTVAFAECEPYCQKVLARHWPGVPIYDDVREVSSARLAADGITGVRAICGGFPCQDISAAGKGAGIDGERSGLWREYARIIGDIRPDFAIVENVRMLLTRGGLRVLADLAAVGYDAEWHVIPASAVGAPHRRDRVWIVAYPSSAGPLPGSYAGVRSGEAGAGSRNGEPQRLCSAFGQAAMAHPNGDARDERRTGNASEGKRGRNADRGPISADPLADAYRERGCGGTTWGENAKNAWQSSASSWLRTWDVEPDVGRVANGVSARVDRLRSLGNAVVPQIPEIIGEVINALRRAA